MQIMYARIDGDLQHLELPDSEEMVLPGIRWGAFDELLTPAFWRGQAWQHEKLGTYERLRLGRNLAEEVAACLLGGFGMKAEIGLAAFYGCVIEGFSKVLLPHVNLSLSLPSHSFVTVLLGIIVSRDRKRATCRHA